MFKSDEFDMVYSWQVFQNMRNPAVAVSLMVECARVLKEGGLLAFQCPIPLPRTVVAGRCKPLKAFLKSVGVKRSHIYWPLRALGVSRELLYARLKLRPEVSVIGMPQDQVTSLLNRAGAQVLEIQRGSFAGLPDVNRTYWITK
jgi:SAM-dependent methyltransferase